MKLKTYIGPQQDLRGKSALTRVDKTNPSFLLVQFDDISLDEGRIKPEDCLANGWTFFLRSEFIPYDFLFSLRLKPLGTVSGRLNCSKPNIRPSLLTPSRDKGVPRVIFEDFSKLEERIFAQIEGRTKIETT